MQENQQPRKMHRRKHGEDQDTDARRISNQGRCIEGNMEKIRIPMPGESATKEDA